MRPSDVFSFGFLVGLIVVLAAFLIDASDGCVGGFSGPDAYCAN